MGNSYRICWSFITIFYPLGFHCKFRECQIYPSRAEFTHKYLLKTKYTYNMNNLWVLWRRCFSFMYPNSFIYTEAVNYPIRMLWYSWGYCYRYWLLIPAAGGFLQWIQFSDLLYWVRVVIFEYSLWLILVTIFTNK